MNVVGFEALMLGAAIGQQLFSCLATTMPDPPSCVYLFQKGKNSHFDLRWPPRLKSVGLLFLFWCFKVEMYSNLTCALKRKKNQFGDQSQFHVAAVFFFSTAPRGNVFKAVQQGNSEGKWTGCLKVTFSLLHPMRTLKQKMWDLSPLLYAQPFSIMIMMCYLWFNFHTDCCTIES